MSFSVIIPSARVTNLVACVTALRQCEPGLPPERTIVVDDGARTAAERLLGALAWVPGEKPFVFARNVNRGIRACQDDVILLNDDAELVTPGGFSAWSELMAREPRLGVCSAGIRGVVGNRRQNATSPSRLELEPSALAFVCVYIPRRVLDQVGLLDERFTGYGFEDDDYCERAVAAGFQLGVWHGCVVSHDGRIPSTYRKRPDFHAMFEQNRRIYAQMRTASPRSEAQRSPEPAVANAGSEIPTPHERLETPPEDGNPYRERRANRQGIKARFEVVSECTEITENGPRLSISLRAVKDEIARDESAAETRVTAVAAPRPEFVCAMRVKNEAEHIREAIESVLPLCERVVLFDDHSTDATVDIARSFGERCSIVSSPFQGLDEARDKNHVLEQLIHLDPAWVLWIDGDEVLERSGPAALRAAAGASGEVSYSLRVAYLWDDAAQVRVDGVYGNFCRPSFFRLRGQRARDLQFRTTGAGGNFHCGNVPAGLKGAGGALPVRLKHYGYLTREQRMQKYRFYTTMDPNNRAEDEYRHIAGIPGARHAPGPPVFVPWTE